MKKFLVYSLKNFSVNNLFLFLCLCSNIYSNYLQDKKNREFFYLIEQERKNLHQILDGKLEKLAYSLQLWSEKSNVGLEKVKNKISLIQDRMVDQQFLLASNSTPPQPTNSFKISLFDQLSFFPSSYILIGIFVGSIYFFYLYGYFNPVSYIKIPDIYSMFGFISEQNLDLSGAERPQNLITNKIEHYKLIPEVIVYDPVSVERPFVVSAEDLTVINNCISSLFSS